MNSGSQGEVQLGLVQIGVQTAPGAVHPNGGSSIGTETIKEKI